MSESKAPSIVADGPERLAVEHEDAIRARIEAEHGTTLEDAGPLRRSILRGHLAWALRRARHEAAPRDALFLRG